MTEPPLKTLLDDFNEFSLSVERGTDALDSAKGNVRSSIIQSVSDAKGRAAKDFGAHADSGKESMRSFLSGANAVRDSVKSVADASVGTLQEAQDVAKAKFGEGKEAAKSATKSVMDALSGPSEEEAAERRKRFVNVFRSVAEKSPPGAIIHDIRRVMSGKKPKKEHVLLMRHIDGLSIEERELIMRALEIGVSPGPGFTDVPPVRGSQRRPSAP